MQTSYFDSNSFTAIVAKVRSRIARGVPAHDLDDVMAEATLGTLQKAAHIGDAKCPEAYCYQVMLNCARSELRHRSRRIATEKTASEICEAASVDLVESSPAEIAVEIHLAIDKAGGNSVQMQAVRLKYLQGMSTEAIAEVFGVSTRTILLRIAEGKARLREILIDRIDLN
ncbi:MAG: sigma-70 family RNA polymerase sigma factor [Pirellulaceae bacterium]